MKWFKPKLKIDQIQLGVGSQTVTLKPDSADIQIAYKIWVELSTRKIGMEVIPEEDVIKEIYNSWYEFFGITRKLIKEIPVSKIKKSETKKIIKLSLDILNKRIRPHLTKWQAKFRKWYEQEIQKDYSKDLSPQEIQEKFPHYKELIDDLLEVNKSLINYHSLMQEIIGYKQ